MQGCETCLVSKGGKRLENKYLSVAEFAAAAGVTQQSVYKRLNKKNDELQPFVKEQNGKRVISAAAITAIYKKPLQQEQPPTEQKEESSLDKIIDILQQQIEAQRKDIAEKNLQIERLSSQLEKEQESLQREQQLHLLTNQKLLALEAAAAEAEEAADIPKEETKKKSIFNWFKKKGD